MLTKLQSLQSSKINKTVNDTRKAIAATIDIVNGIRVAAEKDFRADMKKSGNQLAAKQKEINARLTLLQAERPNIAAEAEAPQQDDQTVPALYKKAKSAEAACIEYTCVYVAFQIWGSK